MYRRRGADSAATAPQRAESHYPHAESQCPRAETPRHLAAAPERARPWTLPALLHPWIPTCETGRSCGAMVRR
jgi:hypothetical protein